MSERRAGVISSRGICVPASPTSLAVDSFPSRGSAPSLVFLLSLSASPTPSTMFSGAYSVFLSEKKDYATVTDF